MHLRTLITSPRYSPAKCSGFLTRLTHFFSGAASGVSTSDRLQTRPDESRAARALRQIPRAYTAAEKEWLSEGDVQKDSMLLDNGKDPVPRFDWRQRTASRARERTVRETQNGAAKTHGKRLRRSKPESLLLHPRDNFYEEVNAYKNRFLPLIEAEQASDEDIIKQRLGTWSPKRLQDEGYCLTGLSAFWLGEAKFGRPVAAFTLGAGISLPNHLFGNGTQIFLSRVDPLKDAPYKGSVVSYSTTQLKVCFEKEFEVEDGVWRMDLGHSNIAYARMRAAIDMLNLDPNLHEKHPNNSEELQVMLQGTDLRDVLLRTFSPTAPVQHDHTYLQDPMDTSYVSHETLEHPSRLTGEQGGAFNDDMRIQSWAKRYREHNPVRVEGDPLLSGLNASQTRAAALMISERISLVQGPPGTGKTKTIIETIKLLKAHFEVVHPLLVCTYTNVAVDNLVEGLAASGVKPLRIGADGKVRASLEEYTLEFKFDAHPLKPKYDRVFLSIQEVREEIRDLKALILKTRNMPAFPSANLLTRVETMNQHLEKLGKRKRVLKYRLSALQQEMTTDIVKGVDVVCTTCITSANYSLSVTDFPVVFLDEASMSTEPASLIPLMKGCRHLALIGDHKQLPPVITSRDAQEGGLSISLFERLAEEGIVPSIMLDTQYRMHPGISRFPSSEFYNFSLLDGTVDSAGRIRSSLMPPISSHLAINPETGHRPSVIFLDHQGREELKSRSRVNWTEGYIVSSIIEDLLLSNQDMRGEHIGVIAPYVSQISLLLRLLTKDPKFRERYISILGADRAIEMANIEVKTVDGFEGREKDIIIFSTVRNNPAGHIGFLADRRRLNVGLTRAKRALFVVGSMSTLRMGKYGRKSSRDDSEQVLKVDKGAEAWRRYAQYLTDQNLVLQMGDQLSGSLGRQMGEQLAQQRGVSPNARRVSQAATTEDLLYY